MLPEGISMKSTPQFRLSKSKAAGASYLTANPFLRTDSTSEDTALMLSSTSTGASKPVGLTFSRSSFLRSDLRARRLSAPDIADRSLVDDG